MNNDISNLTSGFAFGVDIMGGVEKDFDCAGMCTISTYYTFSDIGDGMPTQNCSRALDSFVGKASNVASIWFGIFGGLTFIITCFVSLLNC